MINQFGANRSMIGATTSSNVGAVGIARRARRERQVDVRPDAGAGTGLVELPGARVERRLVRRDVEHVRVVVEHVLGAVAVVDVPVEDRHPLAGRGELGSADGGVVEQAEAHRPVGHRMMAGRPPGGEGDVALVVLQCLDRLHDGAGAAARGGPRADGSRGVRVELAATHGTELLDLLDVDPIVHQREIVDVDELGDAPRDRFVEPGLVDTGERGIEPALALGMPGRGLVAVLIGGSEHGER